MTAHWGWLVGLLILALAATSSGIPALAGAPFALRFVLLALLVALLAIHRRNPRHLAELQRWRVGRKASAWAGVFVGLTLASMAWSVSPRTTALQALALVAVAVAVAFTATRRWVSPQRLLSDVRLVYWVLVGLTLVSLFGAAIRAGFAYTPIGQYRGFFQSATTTGMVAGLTVLLGWGLATVSRPRGLYWATVGSSLATLLISQSRGSIGAFLGACAWMALRGGATRATRAGAVLVLAGLPVFLIGQSTPLVGGVLERFVPQQGLDYSTQRVEAWDRAVDLWQEQPLIGRGYRTTETLFREERRLSRVTFEVDTTHNSYLQVLLELGVVGLLVFVAAITAVLRMAPKRAPRLPSSLFGIVVFGLLAQFTESAIFGTGSVFAFVYWLLVAAAVVVELHRRAARSEIDHIRPALRVGLGS